jgi:hypothetical protein
LKYNSFYIYLTPVQGFGTVVDAVL